MDVRQFTSSVSDDSPDKTLSVPLTALWWDAKGDGVRAHDLVNDLSTKDGMAVHAYLHRKEGDAGNADYWYKRCGAQYRRDSLDEEWNALVEALLTSG